ncbi:MAG: ABC transporter substrate-binding protein [Rhodospirillales bacterium]|nr:ABC transporter substrate-binding protein [Rhodospirillales bacterium]
MKVTPGTRPLDRRTVVAGLAASTAASLFPIPTLGQGTALRVGALLPLTGGLDRHAAQMRLGLDTAADAVNGSGGVLGRPIEIVYADTGTTPRGLAETCARLVREENVAAAIGPFIAAGRKTAARAFGELGVPVVSATNNEGLFCADNFFSVGPTPNQDIFSLVRHLDGGTGRSYFLIGTYSSWQLSSFRQAILKVIYGFNGSVTGQALTPIEEQKFRPIIRWIADTGADTVLFCVPRVPGVHFVHQARELGLLERIKFGWVGFNEMHAHQLPAAEASQVATVSPFVASDTEGGVPDLVARMNRLGGGDVPATYYAYTHYLALAAVAAAAERSGEAHAPAVLDGLKGLTFDSATGPVTIDAESHHAHLGIVAARGSGSNLEIVERLGVIAPEPGCSA